VTVPVSVRSIRAASACATLALAVLLGGCGGAATGAAGLAADGEAIVLRDLGVAIVRVNDREAAVLTPSGIVRVGLAPDGRLTRTGEPIAIEGLAPIALDATNGQDLYIADGPAVRRYSDEGRLVQTLRVPALDRLAGTADPTAAAGETTAVAVASDGRVLVAEASRGTIQVWQGGRLEQVLPREAVTLGLAALGARLFVLTGQGVDVLDADGRPLDSWPVEEIGAPLGIAAHGDALLVRGTLGLALVSADGRRQRGVAIPNNVIGATVLGETVVGLTADAVLVLGRME